MTAAALLRACPQRNGCPLVRPHDLRRLDIAPRLKTIALAAAASVLLHLGAMAALTPREMALIAGGGEDAPAALGTSFADFAEGIMTPSEMDPISPDPTESVPPDTIAEAASTPIQEPIQPTISVPAAKDVSEALLPTPPQQDRLPVLPDMVDAIPPVERLDATSPQDMAQAAQPETLTPDTTPTERAPDASRKPPPRPDRTTPPQPTRQARAPQGNSAQTATRGSQQGAQGQAASETTTSVQASAQGNAAASNYPGDVLRRIQRTRQARSPARGQVLVAFSVANNGSLASVSVTRSSGHAGLDQTAVDHIRRSAPFPPPPSGAQRQFSFEFVGR